jgi:hypothetical protein
MAGATTPQRMVSHEYYSLVDRLQKCYSDFFPGAGTKRRLPFRGYWQSDAIRFRYHSQLDTLIFIADLHEKLDNLLISRRILSFAEGMWAIEMSFDLEAEEIRLLTEIREKLEAYEIMYLR